MIFQSVLLIFHYRIFIAALLITLIEKRMLKLRWPGDRFRYRCTGTSFGNHKKC